VDLVQFLAMLRRRLALILICLIAGVAGGAFFAANAQPVYLAQSRAFLRIPGTQGLGQQIGAFQLIAQVINTYASIATSRANAERIITSLGLDESPADVAGHLNAVVEKQTTIIDIFASASTAAEAQQLSNAALRALTAEVDQLGEGQIGAVTVRTLDTAPLPTAPSSPDKPLDITVGALLGLVVGLAASGILEALDRTVKTSTHGDVLFGAPMLGVVPRRRGNMLVVRRGVDNSDVEPYKALRTAVRFANPDNPVRTILVTSVNSDDGKTTTAANLAVAIALSGVRVVVVDADLRRAQLAKAFGLDSQVGLTSLFLGEAPLNDALQEWDRDISVLASGPLPPNPSEIVGSQLFNQILTSLAGIADVVVIDAPPVLPVTDAVAIASQVDGVLIVARHGKTLRNGASETRRRLDGVGANVIGYVLNAVPARDAQSYYADYTHNTAPRSPAPTGHQLTNH
jgi:capsular exopolysaccharide synthesis family protein